MIAAIACVDENYGIGYNNELLVRIPEDMKHFKKMTTENCVVMGRKTFESLGEKPLPNRTNFIISSKYYSTEVETINGDIVYFLDMHSMKHYLNTARRNNLAKDYYIIGGGQIYEQLLPYCDVIYLTRVLHSYDNVDTYFPNIDEDWQMLYSSEVGKYNDIEYQFCTYRKKPSLIFTNDGVEMVSNERICMDTIKSVENDNVNHPDHYTHGGMECIDEIELIYGTDVAMHFCLGNVHKYRKRALFKNGKEDMKKSDWYMAKYKELIEKPEEQRQYPHK